MRRTAPDLVSATIGRGEPSLVPTCSDAHGANRGWREAERRDGMVAKFWYPTTKRRAANAGTAMTGLNQENQSRPGGAGFRAADAGVEMGSCS